MIAGMRARGRRAAGLIAGESKNRAFRKPNLFSSLKQLTAGAGNRPQRE